LIRTQTGDPGCGACQGALERLKLAHRAARVARFDRSIKPIDALPEEQVLNTCAIGAVATYAAAVTTLGARPELVGLWKQSARVERDDVDQKGLREDRMGDRLVLKAKARREYDAASHDAAYGRNTLSQVEVAACIGRRPRQLVGIHLSGHRLPGGRKGLVNSFLKDSGAVQDFPPLQ